jgi:Mg2+-importing ATPase
MSRVPGIALESAAYLRDALPIRMAAPSPQFALTEAELLKQLGSFANGLTSEAAATILQSVGPNRVAVGPRQTALRDLLHRCRNPLVIQLFIIASVSYAMGDLRSTVVVGGMVFLSVFLSYIQEARSTRAVEKLQKLVKTTVTVLRDGKEVEVPLEEVVPGDVVILAAGSLIPADLRILSAKDFFVSQSALTGESMPVEKNADTNQPAGRAPFEFTNACLMGTNVLSGSARAVVLATGARTYFGALAQKMMARREPTSFDKGVRDFTWLMIRFMLVMVSATFLIVGLTKGNWAQALLFSLSVAVGLTPEMLPMIITVCLSKGAILMARKKVIVKHLHAIQNFGAMDVLCTDKTGTLTQDHVVLERYVDVTSRSSEDVLRYAYMNSFYQTGLRNLLDRAILAHTELDVERNCRKVDEIPFDFKRRRMSVVIDYEDRHVLICKGAVEEISSVCENYQVDEDINPLIKLIRDDLMDEYRNLSAEGYRVLAIAYREFDRSKHTFSVADESALILLGYIAFFDPAKDTSAKAIEALSRHGVIVKILTGDNELVTKKVCHDVAMPITKVVTGPQLAALDDAAFVKLVDEANVLARLTPDQKEKVIKSLRAQGHVVGFMGDGINDVLAMKAADVGISVDTAVDVAKESADIILLEKSLLVLEDGIMEGRKVFGNITKYIKMGASSNFGNMFSVVGGAYFLPFLPMAPIQVLVNNLLYDVSQVGIPLDHVDEEYLAKPRKWNIKSIRNFMVFIGPMSSIFDYATFFLMLYFFGCVAFSAPGTAPEQKTYLERLFHTGWFVESLLTQTLIVHIIRTYRIPFVQSRASKPMLFTTLVIMGVGLWLPFSPLARFLSFTPLPPTYFIWLTGFLIIYGVLTHSVKMWFARRFGTD